MKDKWGRTVCIDTHAYENLLWADGKEVKSPRGYGHWNFHFGGYVLGKEKELRIDFSAIGLFSEVKKAAISQAAKAGYSLVVVCISSSLLKRSAA